MVCGGDGGHSLTWQRCCDVASFLGQVDHIGTAFADDFVTTGFGHHFAMPILREEWRADLTEAEARTLVEKVMRVCYYRDCRTINKVRRVSTLPWTSQVMTRAAACRFKSPR